MRKRQKLVTHFDDILRNVSSVANPKGTFATLPPRMLSNTTHEVITVSASDMGHDRRLYEQTPLPEPPTEPPTSDFTIIDGVYVSNTLDNALRDVNNDGVVNAADDLDGDGFLDNRDVIEGRRRQLLGDLDMDGVIDNTEQAKLDAAAEAETNNWTDPYNDYLTVSPTGTYPIVCPMETNYANISDVLLGIQQDINRFRMERGIGSLAISYDLILLGMSALRESDVLGDVPISFPLVVEAATQASDYVGVVETTDPYTMGGFTHPHEAYLDMKYNYLDADRTDYFKDLFLNPTYNHIGIGFIDSFVVFVVGDGAIAGNKFDSDLPIPQLACNVVDPPVATTTEAWVSDQFPVGVYDIVQQFEGQEASIPTLWAGAATPTNDYPTAPTYDPSIYSTYDPTAYDALKAYADTNPDPLIPDATCPTDKETLPWPVTCPTVRSFQVMRDYCAPMIEEANRYRISRGLRPLIWNDNLALAAQRHASDHYDRYDAYQARTDGLSGHVAVEPAPYGAMLGQRVQAAGWSGGVAEGLVGNSVTGSLKTPMEAWCIFKGEYDAVDEANSAHFKPFVDAAPGSNAESFGYIGIGWKGGKFVFVYGKHDGTINFPPPPLSDPDLTCETPL